MSSQPDDIKKLIAIHQRRLQNLKEQQALYGLGANPSIPIEIEDIETKIEELENELSFSTDESLRTYLRYVIDMYCHIRSQGILSTAELISIDLEKVYVNLKVFQRQIIEPREATFIDSNLDTEDEAYHLDYQFRQGGLEQEVDVNISISAILFDKQRLVVLGEPGSGKTTLLSFLALTFARDFMDNGFVLAEERLDLTLKLMPIFISLRDFSRYLLVKKDISIDGPRLLLDYLAEYFAAQEIELSPNFFRKFLNSGSCLLLLDGLDEIADFDTRVRVARIIEATATNPHYRNNHYIVTSRKAIYQKAVRLEQNFFTVTLRSFDDAAVIEFINKWNLAVETALAGKSDQAIKKRAINKANALIKTIKATPRLRDLVTNPLLLTVVVLVHQYRAQLPERRAELYEECIEVLLAYWDKARGMPEKDEIFDGWILDAGDKRSYLAQIALWMQERKLREIDRDAATILLSILFEGISDSSSEVSRGARLFLQIIYERSGLLTESEMGVYSFPHLSFQEYLAARAIADREDYIEYTLNLLGDPWWREVILLEAGYLSIGGKGRTSKLIESILVYRNLEKDYFDATDNLILAAECLESVGKGRVLPNLLREITERLLTYMTDEDKLIEYRIIVGNILGRVGDPRFSGRYLEPEMVRIPSGQFKMGSDETDRLASTLEKPSHLVFLGDYWIAKYPITNAQYRRFIDDGGYDEPSFWTTSGWDWRKDKIVDGEAYEDDRAPEWSGGGALVYTRNYWVERGYIFPNHPVVYVTWYEAVAYCRWLAQVTHKAYRLPTEAEWEKAARGIKGQIYPWGNEFADTKCNTDESGIGNTTPVGFYLSGASPYGVFDMCGNAREWVSTPEHSYPYSLDNDNEDILGIDRQRVFRSGSWLEDHVTARCAYRYSDPPALFPDVTGFRVAFSE